MFFIITCIWLIDISLLSYRVAQLVREFALQVDEWVFESQPLQTLVVKTGSDSYTAECWAIGVSLAGPQRWL